MKNQIKKRVKLYLHENHMTQQAFAKKVGLSQPVISSLLRGFWPHEKSIIKIKEFLDSKIESKTEA